MFYGASDALGTTTSEDGMGQNIRSFFKLRVLGGTYGALTVLVEQLQVVYCIVFGTRAMQDVT